MVLSTHGSGRAMGEREESRRRSLNGDSLTGLELADLNFMNSRVFRSD